MRLSLLKHGHDVHQEGVWALAWVPNSDLLVTGSLDETVAVWNTALSDDELKLLRPQAGAAAAAKGAANVFPRHHSYTGHSLGVVSVAVDPTGTYIGSSSLDSCIRIWNLHDHTTKYVRECTPTESWGMAFGPTTPEGAVTVALAGGSRNDTSLFRAGGSDECEALATFTMPQAPLAEGERKPRERFSLSVAFSPDGTKLAAGAMDGTVAVFDTATGRQAARLEGHYKAVRSLCFSPDGSMVLTACDDGHAHLYDAHHGALIDSFSGHESWVLSVAAHPQGNAFATASSDAKVRLWDLQTRQCVQTVAEHTDQVWGVAFNSAGTRLATVSDDRSVALYSCA